MARLMFRWALVWLALMALAGPASADAGLLGNPPYQRFQPDIDVYPQDFAVVQDPRGIVYVGNNDGVLEFDGERWRLIVLPNRDIVRSLAVADDGRVYVGGYNAFGYLRVDANGRVEFEDLTARFTQALGGREFADIWDTYVTPEGVYFRAVRDLFFWDPRTGKTAFWHHEGRFGAIQFDHGRTLVQFRGEGIKRRDGDSWRLLPETAGLTTLIYQLVPLPGGALLSMGSDGAWWRIAPGKVEKLAMPEGMPDSAHFENALPLSDGSIAFASRDGQIYLVAPGLGSERHFKIDSGYLSGLSATFDGGFLVSGDQAIYRIAWPTEWSVLGSEHGADGSLTGIADWNSARYLMSSAGARRVSRAAGGALSFLPDPWGELTVYDLIGLDADRALLARAHKLMLADHGKLSEVSSELVYPRMFRPSRFHPERIYLGTEAGLRVIRIDGAKPVLSASLESGESMRVSSFAEVGPDEIWTGTERDGVWRYRFSPDGSLLDFKRYGENEGLRLGMQPEAWVTLLADGSLVASTREGFFRFDGAGFQPVAMDGLAPLRASGEMLRVVQAPNRDLWAYGSHRLFRHVGPGAWREQDVRNLKRGALVGHHFDADGKAVFVSGQALLLHDGGTPSARRQAPRLVLRAVTEVLPDGNRQSLPLDSSKPMHLAAGDFGVAFEFALPDLTREGIQRYRGRLLGYEQDFSEWSRAHGYTYSRLSPGDYRLEVQAMDSFGRISAIAPYRLIVDPAWYATNWARALWLLLVAAAVWGASLLFVRRRTRRLANEKLILESTVAERTSELADANRRLEMMANLDGLTGIPNRRRLDEYLAVVWTQCRERTRPLSVLAIDVDRFKEFNDQHGHLAGDELLKQLVARLGRCLRRAEDLLARYGGEEFLVVLPGGDIEVARELAEAMRQSLESSELGVTVSIGVASQVPKPDDPVTELLARADSALYAAKNTGRNRVVAAP